MLGFRIILRMSRKRFWEQEDSEEEGADLGREGGADLGGLGGDVREGSDSEAEEDPMNPSPEYAGVQFVELLLDLKYANKISMKDVCCASWWASKAGAVGPACELGKHPYCKSAGDYQKHVDRKMGFNEQMGEQCILQCPGHAVHSNERVLLDLAVAPPRII